MEIRTRPLEAGDLPEADRILRMAFGTFLGLPEPLKMFGDSDIAGTRYRADPEGALAAEAEGRLVGSNFVTNWGSFGYFGPLSVEPRLWNQKVAQRLLEPTIALFERWRCRHTGLFTFSHSAKHHALYQKFDFWPRFLTPVMSQRVGSATEPAGIVRFSELAATQKEEAVAGCRELTAAIYEGLDVSREVRAVDAQRLGDTIMLLEGSKVAAFGVCHAGAKTEAGSGSCYVKFAAVRPGRAAARDFERLLDGCAAYAARAGAQRLEAGVNMSRREAYRIMIGRGFRTDLVGVAMQKSDDAGFNRPGIFLLDDWR